MKNNIKTLQLFYASALADSVYHYDTAGILSLVTETKKNQQALTAPIQLEQLGIANPKDLFQLFSEVFGCIQWAVSDAPNGFHARGNHCMLCTLAKRINTAQPCFIYCINPIRGLLKALKPSYQLIVEKTLWENDACIFKAAAISHELT